jgi:hypothetical protein
MCVCVYIYVYMCIYIYIYILHLSDSCKLGGGDPCFTLVRPNRLNPLHNEILNLVQLVRVLNFIAILSIIYHAKRH